MFVLLHKTLTLLKSPGTPQSDLQLFINHSIAHNLQHHKTKQNKNPEVAECVAQ